MSDTVSIQAAWEPTAAQVTVLRDHIELQRLQAALTRATDYVAESPDDESVSVTTERHARFIAALMAAAQRLRSSGYV